MYWLVLTVPGRATRPRSLRPRSTSITCSARSLGSRRSSSASRSSSAGLVPRGRVPAIGCVVMRSPTTWSRSSGLAPTTSNDGVRVKNRYGDGLTRRRARYRPMPSRALPSARTGRSNDWRRASTTWIASPAAIASFAASTARMYWSRPSEVSTWPRPASAGAVSVLPSPARPKDAAISAAEGRAVLSSASKIARSAMRYRPSRSGASVCSEAIAESWWVRWSNTITRSVSMNAASGTPTGSRAGRGTDGSKVEMAS